MALVYYATLADLSFDSFQDRGDIIVDGNVTTHTVLGAMLSALRDGRVVYFADASSGRTGGAGILAGAAPDRIAPLVRKTPKVIDSDAFERYRLAWRSHLSLSQTEKMLP
jgi:hypothetical protein